MPVLLPIIKTNKYNIEVLFRLKNLILITGIRHDHYNLCNEMKRNNVELFVFIFLVCVTRARRMKKKLF